MSKLHDDNEFHDIVSGLGDVENAGITSAKKLDPHEAMHMLDGKLHRQIEAAEADRDYGGYSGDNMRKAFLKHAPGIEQTYDDLSNLIYDQHSVSESDTQHDTGKGFSLVGGNPKASAVTRDGICRVTGHNGKRCARALVGVRAYNNISWA